MPFDCGQENRKARNVCRLYRYVHGSGEYQTGAAKEVLIDLVAGAFQPRRISDHVAPPVVPGKVGDIFEDQEFGLPDFQDLDDVVE